MPYSLRFIGNKEALMAAKLKAERYTLSFPELNYRVLLKAESIVEMNEERKFYKSGSRGDRKYKNYPMFLRPVYSPEDMGLSGFGLDTTRQIMFFGASYLFSEAGIDPAKGDLIVWDGDPFEVFTVKPKEDSQISLTNFFTELEIVADIPFTDMPQTRNED
jgi:hypothetical protein